MPAFKEYILGIDVGSVSANIVSIGPDGEIAEEYYIRTCGKPFETVENFLSTYQRNSRAQIKGVAFTGTAGQFIAQRTGGHCENEIVAQTRAVSHLAPQTRTVIEWAVRIQNSSFLNQRLPAHNCASAIFP
jgi:activator of 2-hydroxyglutaryl-CoA dehydratase